MLSDKILTKKEIFRLGYSENPYFLRLKTVAQNSFKLCYHLLCTWWQLCSHWAKQIYN